MERDGEDISQGSFCNRTPVSRKSINFVALLLLVALCALECTAQETICRRDYEKREDKESQGLEDGGCYMCSAYEGSKLPGYGDSLKQQCQQMCDSDPLCLSFSVARTPVLAANEYRYNNAIENCCLYRREYPAKAYVDATKVQKGELPNMCQQQATCWTRYELDTSALVQNDNCDSSSYTKLPSNMCKQTWAPTEYDEETITDVMKTMEEGCRFEDKLFQQLLWQAYRQCKRERDAEAGTVTMNVKVNVK
mmetsp:Transcript_26757/g.63444  ORF Transcript_26757/g.63444 Transcript_26757/m.63444 type:complete len:251 (+) Transcript_26757:62-814(+)